MDYSGNIPCTATPTDTGPCECELIDDFTDSTMFSRVIFCQFQMKGHGPHGVLGEPALEHAIQTLEYD